MWNQKGSEHWVTAVHSSEDKCNLYYLDTWESKDAQRARMPEDIVANVNCFLAQQNLPIAVAGVQLLNAPSQQECSCGC